MVRIWTLLGLLPIIYTLMWLATAKGADYDQTDSQLSYDFNEQADSGAFHGKRQRRDYDIEKYVDKAETDRLWEEWKNMTREELFNNGYRLVKTLVLPFDFPFFGQSIRNITVTTGGFIYTGNYLPSWSATTQYIAPLMANFYVETTQDSLIYVIRNETAITVIWENLVIEKDKILETFTFSATLHKNGEILFAYYKVPRSIDSIDKSIQPVKVGLSDAYIFQAEFFARKTIHEYTRLDIELLGNIDGTIVRLKPLSICPAYKDCQSCLNHDINLQCTWCTAVNRCSTRDGKDRGKQQ